MSEAIGITIIWGVVIACAAYILFWRRDPVLEAYVEAVERVKAEAAASLTDPN